VNSAVTKELLAIGTVHWNFVASFQAEHRGLCLKWSMWRRVPVFLRFLISPAHGVFRISFPKSCGHVTNVALLVDVSSDL